MDLTRSLFSLSVIVVLLFSNAEEVQGWCNEATEEGAELCGRVYGYPEGQLSLDVPFIVSFDGDLAPSYNVSCYFQLCPPAGICGSGNCEPTSDSTSSDGFTATFYKSFSMGRPALHFEMGYSCPGANAPYGRGYVGEGDIITTGPDDHDHIIIKDGTSACFKLEPAPAKPEEEKVCAENGLQEDQFWIISNFLLEARMDTTAAKEVVGNSVGGQIVSQAPGSAGTASASTSVKFRIRNSLTGLELTCEHAFDDANVLLNGGQVEPAPGGLAWSQAGGGRKLIVCENPWNMAGLTWVAQLRFGFDEGYSTLYVESFWDCSPPELPYYQAQRNSAHGYSDPIDLTCDGDASLGAGANNLRSQSPAIRCRSDSSFKVLMNVTTSVVFIPIP